SDTRHASPSSSAEPEHGSATTNDPKARWAASVAATSFHAPCPSDCGLAANGSGNNARPRDAAALADAQRPRPPTRVVLLRHDSDLPLVSARKHRLAPPRAPPCSLDS
ncbi:MAG TPA: hypothetical protein VJT82_05160, partial [Pyrinomonadaceae bacterium]|nr:hypothetical protein [Pyrinomonadaceae bacterium]